MAFRGCGGFHFLAAESLQAAYLVMIFNKNGPAWIESLCPPLNAKTLLQPDCLSTDHISVYHKRKSKPICCSAHSVSAIGLQPHKPGWVFFWINSGQNSVCRPVSPVSPPPHSLEKRHSSPASPYHSANHRNTGKYAPLL